MHRISIPQSVIDDVVRSRGREHVFENLDPAKTALIVVDMQNGFLMKGVAHALCEEAWYYGELIIQPHRPEMEG